jgi:AraC family transcriptional regulator
MQPEIKSIEEKKLIGRRIRMSFSDNKTHLLWRSFIPGRQQIKNTTGTELYSVEIYPAGFFQQFEPVTTFEKWAAVAVKDFNSIPDGMEALILPVGLYAVFLHRGPAGAVLQTYRYILETWLPGSGFLLDDRPHFSVMGEKYKNEDPDSEEEIGIPVRKITQEIP